MPFEKAVRAVILKAAFEEQPLDPPLGHARLDFADQPLADAVRTPRRFDGHILQHGEAAARAFLPSNHRDPDDRPAIAAGQQVALVAEFGEVVAVELGEIGCPLIAVRAQPGLDLAMADIARVKPDYAAGEIGGFARRDCRFLPLER